MEFPADIIVSYRHPFMSVGYQAPVGSANEIGTAGSHGAMDRLGSMGALLSEERELPSVVRSDNLLELFPALVDHLRERDVVLYPGRAGRRARLRRAPVEARACRCPPAGRRGRCCPGPAGSPP